jgi:hypothetical protein
MLSRASILYGAALSAVVAGATVAVPPALSAGRHPDQAAGPLAWERHPACHPRQPVLH